MQTGGHSLQVTAIHPFITSSMLLLLTVSMPYNHVENSTSSFFKAKGVHLPNASI